MWHTCTLANIRFNSISKKRVCSNNFIPLRHVLWHTCMYILFIQLTFRISFPTYATLPADIVPENKQNTTLSKHFYRGPPTLEEKHMDHLLDVPSDDWWAWNCKSASVLMKLIYYFWLFVLNGMLEVLRQDYIICLLICDEQSASALGVLDAQLMRIMIICDNRKLWWSSKRTSPARSKYRLLLQLLPIKSCRNRICDWPQRLVEVHVEEQRQPQVAIYSEMEMRFVAQSKGTFQKCLNTVLWA